LRRGRRSGYEDIQVDLTLLTFWKLGPTVLLSSAGVVGMTALLAQHYADTRLWQLAMVMLTVAVVRLGAVVAFSFLRSEELTEASASRWETVYGMLTFAFCSSVAAVTLYNFRYHDATAQGLCVIATFSSCAALSSRIGMRLRTSQMSGLVMLAALMVSVLQSPEPLTRAGGVLICFFGYAHLESVRKKFDILVDQLRSKKKLRGLAEQDSLTGLVNHRHFLDCLASSCGGTELFSVLFVDLDRFKQINDCYGHSMGDLALQQVAARLSGQVGETDVLARLGGDEFAILQRSIDSSAAAVDLALRINSAMAAPFELEDYELSIGASIGIRLSNKEGDDPRVLLDKADQALYLVKQAGGGSFYLSHD
jgi:diguanylate cyclase (GGDEF)-like protein